MTQSEPKQQSRLLVALISAAVSLGVAILALLGGIYGAERQFHADSLAAEKQLSGTLVSTAVDVLKETPESQTEIRKWARDIIEANSGIPLNEEAAGQFRGLSRGTALSLLGAGESTEILPLREGTTLSLPQLGIREIDVQLQESQDTAIVRITLVFMNGETDRVTLAEGQAGGAEIHNDYGSYRIEIHSVDLENKLVLLRFQASGDVPPSTEHGA